MKRMIVIVCLMAACAIGAYAQNPYAGITEDGWSVHVGYKGARPTILDFANAYLDDESVEFLGQMRTALRQFKSNRPVSKGLLTVDSKNGYLSYEDTYDDGDERSSAEMCYWNCSDGKHKLFAVSQECYQNGKPIQTEFTGLSFFLYNNATRNMTTVGMEDIGVVIETNDVVTFTLPQKGKNIIMNQYSDHGIISHQLIWDGYVFHLQ